MEEIEVKFLEIDIDILKNKLKSLGATFMGSFDYKRKAYDFADRSLAEKNAWVRLRDEGDRVVLTYKQRFGIEKDILQGGGMKEVETIVSDFVITDEFLSSIGMIQKFYEENKRERYILDNVEIDIDTWPMIPPYVELEGSTWNAVEAVSKKLGFDWSKHFKCSTMQIYEKYGINENDYSVITFTEQIKK